MKLHALMTGAALTALMAGGALAQDTATDPNTVPPAATDPMLDNRAAEVEPVFASIEEMTVGDMLGMVAHDPEGDRIGEIDYVLETGEGPAAVIGIGGFIGLGEYTVALPLEAFQLSDDGTFFTLDTDKETLKAQPEFDESGAESLPDETPIAQLMTEMPETEGEIETEVEVEGDAELETEVEGEIEGDAEVEGSTGGDTDTEVETDMDSGTGDTAVEMETEADTEMEAETEVETETETETETGTDTDAETGAPMTTVPNNN